VRAFCAIFLPALLAFASPLIGTSSSLATSCHVGGPALALETGNESRDDSQTPPKAQSQPEPPQSVRPEQRQQPPKEAPGTITLALTPLRVFAVIEKAWNEGQPDSIAQFFPEDGILLRLEKTAPEKAFYTNKQATYMLTDEFRFTMTESFEFVEFKYSKGGDDPPFARAQWSFRREPGGKLTVQKVRIGLRNEADRWVVSEIRIQE